MNMCAKCGECGPPWLTFYKGSIICSDCWEKITKRQASWRL